MSKKSKLLYHHQLKSIKKKKKNRSEEKWNNPLNNDKWESERPLGWMDENPRASEGWRFQIRVISSVWTNPIFFSYLINKPIYISLFQSL